MLVQPVAPGAGDPPVALDRDWLGGAVEPERAISEESIDPLPGWALGTGRVRSRSRGQRSGRHGDRPDEQ